MTGSIDTEPAQAYRDIEAKFDACCTNGEISVDRYLAHPERDQRRGLSLIFQPSSRVLDRITEIKNKLRPWLDGQYYYPGSDLHVTVLSLIPVGQLQGTLVDSLPACIAAVQGVLQRHGSAFAVRFQGISGSDEAILVKGYPCDGHLQTIRVAILTELRALGVEQNLRRRYVNRTAHITFIRFTQQINDFRAVQGALSDLREVELGTMNVGTLQLVENEWYMRGDSRKPYRQFTVSC